MTHQKQYKNPLNFTLWTTFTHRNFPFWKTTQCYISKLNQCTANMKRISVIWNCNALSVTDLFFVSTNHFRTWKLFRKTFHACVILVTQRYLGSYFKLVTAWKVSKYGVIFGPCFPAFGLNTGRYSVSLRIQCEYREIRTRNNSVFGYFSRIVWWILKLRFT